VTDPVGLQLPETEPLLRFALRFNVVAWRLTGVDEEAVMMDRAWRKIIHIDMDAFYAAVEQRDDPALRGKPVAVGGARERGVVAAASYEARRYGVRSAMPSMRAYRLCPHLIFVPPRFDHYRQISQHIRDILAQYTALVEPLSLDEAYVDVTTNKKGNPSATHIAQDMRAQIWEETRLTASAGVSINKFLAKIASDMNKPNGLTLIPPEQAEAFLERLPIEKFYGIGQKTSDKMKRLGIHCGADLKARTELDLAQQFGKVGRHFFRIVRAMDDRGVQPDRLRKAVGIETTFHQDLSHADDMLAILRGLTDKVCERLRRLATAAMTVTLKIKYLDFVQATRSKTLDGYQHEVEQLFPVVEYLLYHPEFPPRPVRLLGVSLSHLDYEADGVPQQLQLPLQMRV
jgi:DNA polymerase IV